MRPSMQRLDCALVLPRQPLHARRGGVMTLRMCLAVGGVVAFVGAGCSGDRSDDLTNNLGTGDRDSQIAEDGAMVDAGDVDGEPDASEPDAAQPDAAQPDAAQASGGFRLSVESVGQPVAGRTVLFHAADGAILEQQVTDAAGSAYRESAPAMATVLVMREPYAYAHQVQLLTFLATKAGDHIVVTVEENDDAQTQTLFNAVLVTPLPSATGSVAISSSNGCVGGYASIQVLPAIAITRYSDCQLPAQANPLLAVATDNELFATRAYALAQNVTLPANGPVPLPFGPWLTPNTVSLSMLGAPPSGVEFVSPELSMVLGGQRFQVEAQNDTFSLDPAQFPVLPEGVSGLEVTANYYALDGNVSLMRSSPVQAELTLDFDDVPPDFPQPSVSENGSPLRPTFERAPGASQDQLDAVYVVAAWNSESGQARWGFVGPTSATSFRAPVLPAELISDLEGFAEGVPSVTSVTVLASDAVTGYDGFRARPFPVVQDYEPTHLLQWPLQPNEAAQLRTWFQVGI